MTTYVRPVINAKTLRAAVLVGVPTVIAVLQVVEFYEGKPMLSDPSFWIKVIQVSAAILFGKEVLVGKTQVSEDELPLEMVLERKSQAGS